ncbi:hypothetical protein ILP97_35165 [Amycolatopsis sp. H6(2020)]|nr:hypothetical protein [Amycolatopsis sp. H6(2020)]
MGRDPHLKGAEQVIVIDDAQWADQPSTAAVRLAVRRLAGEPLMAPPARLEPGARLQ